MRFEREHSIIPLVQNDKPMHTVWPVISCFCFSLCFSPHILSSLDTGAKSYSFAKDRSYQMTLVLKSFSSSSAKMLLLRHYHQPTQSSVPPVWTVVLSHPHCVT